MSQLKRVLHQLNGQLKSELDQISTQVSEVQENSGRIAAGAEDQSEAVNRTTTYVEQLSLQFDSVAENANAAQRSALKAGEVASQARSMVEQHLEHIDGFRTRVEGAERKLETVAQGAAFAEALKSWPESERIACPPETPLPVIVGAACQAGGIALEEGLSGFLQAFVSNQLQAAIRLSVIGQTGAARLLAKLEPMLVKAAGDADGSTLDDLGSATVMAEIASMNHETLDGRLFRS